ncbi:MAG: hypothetical protein K9N49_10400, partial [Candidatus Marinimicrobia bacterium]|nr:hypothetical protein [Candidatus Neomarinimicrobiota bacterium]
VSACRGVGVKTAKHLLASRFLAAIDGERPQTKIGVGVGIGIGIERTELEVGLHPGSSSRSSRLRVSLIATAAELLRAEGNESQLRLRAARYGGHARLEKPRKNISACPTGRSVSRLYIKQPWFGILLL